MSEHDSQSGWKRFWERGGVWKALILAAVYYAVYQLFSLLVKAIFGESGGVRGEAGSAMDVFIGTALPIILGSLALLVFAASVGWLKELFARQTIRGRGWMWIGVAFVLVINVSSLLGLDYGKAGLPVVALSLIHI